jgi:hypothetical protein
MHNSTIVDSALIPHDGFAPETLKTSKPIFFFSFFQCWMDFDMKAPRWHFIYQQRTGFA